MGTSENIAVRYIGILSIFLFSVKLLTNNLISPSFPSFLLERELQLNIASSRRILGSISLEAFVLLTFGTERSILSCSSNNARVEDDMCLLVCFIRDQ